MSPSDEELLDALRQALVPGTLVPGEEEMALFHRALTDGPLVPSPEPARPRITPRWVLTGAAAAAVAALGAFGGGVAADTLPGPLRTAAFDLGLPVSSPALAGARGVESELQAALSARDRSAVAADSTVLRQRLTELDTADRAQAEPEADALLVAADNFLAANPAPAEGSQPGPGSTEPSEPTTTEPTEQPGRTTTSEPTDNPGGSDSGSPSGSSETTSPTDGSKQLSGSSGDQISGSG